MKSGNVWIRFRIAQRLRGTAGSWAAALLAVFPALPALATSSVPRPVLSTWVTTPYLTPALNIEPVHVGKLPYAFGALIAWPERDIVYTKGADVYFGILLPGGSSVLSWTVQNGVPTLVPGYVPFARAIPNTGNFQPFAVNRTGYPLTYTFNGTEPKGLYFAYLILTYPGADPNDSRQWNQVSTHPFVVK
ncbi:hypothetical protein HZ993_24100 [Rhodoferax sp. AJA081-3]|uniref:hypothetical protein n=1 Tax=Rhodoferax sp. AJA081-3 TaxID=2752316 RepID=UPI001ADF9ECA|nr:hypothetical protein [Rhodoferax sp. AJA081-3]QTN28272.1 hypothetical protein HZ993_24100 [Rhodoferax sp. AJA081-3]